MYDDADKRQHFGEFLSFIQLTTTNTTRVCTADRFASWCVRSASGSKHRNSRRSVTNRFVHISSNGARFQFSFFDGVFECKCLIDRRCSLFVVRDYERCFCMMVGMLSIRALMRFTNCASISRLVIHSVCSVWLIDLGFYNVDENRWRDMRWRISSRSLLVMCWLNISHRSNVLRFLISLFSFNIVPLNIVHCNRIALERYCLFVCFYRVITWMIVSCMIFMLRARLWARSSITTSLKHFRRYTRCLLNTNQLRGKIGKHWW